jgi:hypothetical protein
VVGRLKAGSLPLAAQSYVRVPVVPRDRPVNSVNFAVRRRLYRRARKRTL